MKYSDYINKYHRRSPGEHHLVAVYLVPLLMELWGKYPIYVNPDGMKSVLGDLVYEINSREISFEVKLSKIQLTKTQRSQKYSPDYLLAFDETQIGYADWRTFQEEYRRSTDTRIQESDNDYKNYGPVFKMDEMSSITRTDHVGLRKYLVDIEKIWK